MLRFSAIEMMCFSPELGHYPTFGILAEYTDASGRPKSQLIPDVSCNRDFVCELVQKCSLLALDPVHLLDVVLDSLP